MAGSDGKNVYELTLSCGCVLRYYARFPEGFGFKCRKHGYVKVIRCVNVKELVDVEVKITDLQAVLKKLDGNLREFQRWKRTIDVRIASVERKKISIMEEISQLKKKLEELKPK